MGHVGNMGHLDFAYFCDNCMYVCTYVGLCMDGWMDEWMDGWMYTCMCVYMYACMHVYNIKGFYHFSNFSSN